MTLVLILSLVVLGFVLWAAWRYGGEPRDPNDNPKDRGR